MLDDSTALVAPAQLDKEGQSNTPPHDDLKIIHGIGAAVEKRLNAIGIVTFAQLRETSPDEIAAALKGLVGYTIERIRTQDWIGQAQRFDNEHSRSRNRSASPQAEGESAEVMLPGDLEDLPPIRQPYAVFTIEFLLDEDNHVRRTQVLNVQNQQAGTWAGWDAVKLTNFFKQTAGMTIAAPAMPDYAAKDLSTREVAPEPISAEKRSALATVVDYAPTRSEEPVHYRGKLSILDWRIVEGDRRLKHLVLTNQPFDMHFTIDFSGTLFRSDEILLCEVSLYARQKRFGTPLAERILIGHSVEKNILLQKDRSGEPEAATNMARTIRTRGILQYPGEYQIEAVAVLRPANQPISQKNQASGLLEGILIRAYEGS